MFGAIEGWALGPGPALFRTSAPQDSPWCSRRVLLAACGPGEQSTRKWEKRVKRLSAGELDALLNDDAEAPAETERGLRSSHYSDECTIDHATVNT